MGHFEAWKTTTDIYNKSRQKSIKNKNNQKQYTTRCGLVQEEPIFIKFTKTVTFHMTRPAITLSANIRCWIDYTWSYFMRRCASVCVLIKHQTAAIGHHCDLYQCLISLLYSTSPISYSSILFFIFSLLPFLFIHSLSSPLDSIFLVPFSFPSNLFFPSFYSSICKLHGNITLSNRGGSFIRICSRWAFAVFLRL